MGEGGCTFSGGGYLVRRQKLPILKLRKGIKGRPQPTGTRLRKYGLTPEEQYMQYAPEGTKPERLVFGWLLKHKFMFDFQQPVMGGRIPGGAVVDFIIYDKQPPIALRIMSFWHESPEVKWTDDIQAENLFQLGYQVEDVWEREINTLDKVDYKMRQIIFGAPKMRTVIPVVEKVCSQCGSSQCVGYRE